MRQFAGPDDSPGLCGEEFEGLVGFRVQRIETNSQLNMGS